MYSAFLGSWFPLPTSMISYDMLTLGSNLKVTFRKPRLARAQNDGLFHVCHLNPYFTSCGPRAKKR